MYNSFIMKISAFIITSEKYEDRRNRIRNTWGTKINYLFVSDHEDFDTIKITEESNYQSAEIKSVEIKNKMPYEYLDNDYFFFCDDDTFLNVDFLISNLSSFKKNYVYGHQLSCWPPDRSLCFLSGGAGYLMSKEILFPIMGEIPILNSGANDVTLGLFFREKKIKIAHDDRFNPFTPETMKKNEVEKNFTFHYIQNDELMNELFVKCNK